MSKALDIAGILRTAPRMLFAALAFAAVACVLTVSNAKAGNPDPRQCFLHTASTCGNHAAVVALRRKMSLLEFGKADLRWTADITCTATAASNLLWSCAWKPSTSPQKATVKFWATSTGWHTKVTLTA